MPTMKNFYWKLAHFTLILATLLIGCVWFSLNHSLASAQEEGCPPLVEGAGCASIGLYPENLTGDYYVDDVLVASANRGNILVPAQTSARVDIRSIHDDGAGFGDTYSYRDTSLTVWVASDRTRSYAVYPSKLWHKGFLKITCGIRHAAADELAACRPIIDGAPRSEIAPGDYAIFNLTPGAHPVRVERVGEHADRWLPDARERTAYITAGYNAYFTASFLKKGLLTIALNQPGVVGDLYVDGSQVATQSATTQLWVNPYRSHLIEVHNISDPAAGTAYRWRDARNYAYLSPDQQQTVTLSLAKQAASANPTPTTPAVTPTGTVGAPPPAGTPSRAAPSLYTGTFSNIPGSARQIFLRGQQMGREPLAFSKIGDSETSEAHFLQIIPKGEYNLGQYTHLLPVLVQMQESLGRVSEAAHPGFSVHTMLDALWSDPDVCQPGETPLACEFRIHNPAFAIIMVRTWNIDMFAGDMEKLIQYCIEQGVVPIVSTLPHQTPPPWADEVPQNEIIRNLANKYQVPLWDLNVTTERLGFRGVCDECGDHLTLPPEFKVAYFMSPYMDYGATRRNLEALEVLHAMMFNVIYQ